LKISTLKFVVPIPSQPLLYRGVLFRNIPFHNLQEVS
jgi:hypothetical protein